MTSTVHKTKLGSSLWGWRVWGFLFCFLRQGLYIWPWLSGNLICRPGWSWTERSFCLCLLSVGIKSWCHHTQREFYFARRMMCFGLCRCYMVLWMRVGVPGPLARKQEVMEPGAKTVCQWSKADEGYCGDKLWNPNHEFSFLLTPTLFPKLFFKLCLDLCMPIASGGQKRALHPLEWSYRQL